MNRRMNTFGPMESNSIHELKSSHQYSRTYHHHSMIQGPASTQIPTASKPMPPGRALAEPTSATRQDSAPPPLAKARVWDASCQSDAPAYCQAEVQATVAHSDGQVQADDDPSLATADAICGTEDLAEADAKREAATSAEIESLRREVADRRRVTSKLVDVVAARSSAPLGFSQWAGIPRLSVLIVRADGLPGGLGQLRCEASLTGQAESRAWTRSAVCTL
jgi:hypothetical protein